MTSDDLKNIIAGGESQHVEFKRSFNKKVIETIVAFSNKNGGRILIGINNNGKANGITITPETIQKWVNGTKQNTGPAILPETGLVEYEGKKVAVSTINEFPLKPVSFKGPYFIRRHNSDHLLSASEIAELQFVSLNYSFDSFGVQTTFKELDMEAIRAFNKKVKNSGRYKSSGEIKTDQRMVSLISLIEPKYRRLKWVYTGYN